MPFKLFAGSDLFMVLGCLSAEFIVVLGSKVKVENITDGKKLAFIFVEGENALDDGKIGVYMLFGQVFFDVQVGDEVEY